MKRLLLPIYSVALLALLNGCSSSTTTAQAPKSADDQVRELMVQLASLPKDAKKEDGQAIVLKMMALRGQASEKTQKDLDLFLNQVVVSIHSDTNATRTMVQETGPEVNLIPEKDLHSDIDSSVTEVENAGKTGKPERGPPPREVK